MDEALCISVDSFSVSEYLRINNPFRPYPAFLLEHLRQT
jgi:hypothetical protein